MNRTFRNFLITLAIAGAGVGVNALQAPQAISLPPGESMQIIIGTNDVITLNRSGAAGTVTPTKAPAGFTPSPVLPTATSHAHTGTAPAGNIAPFRGAPECPDNNRDGHSDVTNSKYFDILPDGQIPHTDWNAKQGCFYNHEHGDVALLDAAEAVFGVFGQEWGGNGGINHPFHTPDEHNVFKHRTHKISIGLNNPAVSVEGATLFVKNYRILQHMDFFAMPTRFHSFSIEMEVCRVASPTTCGKLFRGGHLDIGPLVNQSKPGTVNSELHVPVPADNIPFPLVTCGTTNRRLHNPDGINNARFATWYGNFYPSFNCLPSAYRASGKALGVMQIGVLISDAWATLNTSDPLNPIITCPNGSCGLNSSRREQGHLIAGEFTAELDILDGTQNGRITLSGFTNIYGFIDKTCTAVSVNCVPFYFDNVPVGVYQYRDSAFGIKAKEYGSMCGGQPCNFITYPN